MIMFAQFTCCKKDVDNFPCGLTRRHKVVLHARTSGNIKFQAVPYIEQFSNSWGGEIVADAVGRRYSPTIFLSSTSRWKSNTSLLNLPLQNNCENNVYLFKLPVLWDRFTSPRRLVDFLYGELEAPSASRCRLRKALHHPP